MMLCCWNKLVMKLHTIPVSDTPLNLLREGDSPVLNTAWAGSQAATVLLFCVKAIVKKSRNFELAHLKKVTKRVVGHENT